MFYTPGIYDGISNADYHNDPALGSTSLKTLATKTPAHYKYDQEHPKTSDAFTLGTAAHSLILENDTTQFEIVDAANWLTKDAKAAKAEALTAGRVPLLTKEFEQVQAMRDAVMANPLARTALTGHKAEYSAFWEHESGTMIKTRPDAMHDGGPLGNLIVDLKTCASADPNEFGRTAHQFGYHIQQAHYQAGLKAVTGEDFDFLFVLVEKQPPFLVSVVELDAEDVARGAELAERGIRIFNDCTKSGVWPGYESSRPIEIPQWARYQEEDALSK